MIRAILKIVLAMTALANHAQICAASPRERVWPDLRF